jgi:predicted transcriptional regulator
MSVYKKLARTHDPESSHIAAQRMVQSGAQNAQQQVVLDLVRKHPGSTSDELGEYGLLDRYQIARRLPELESAGFIVKGPMRKSTKTGRPAVTWKPHAPHERGAA